MTVIYFERGILTLSTISIVIEKDEEDRLLLIAMKLYVIQEHLVSCYYVGVIFLVLVSTRLMLWKKLSMLLYVLRIYIYIV